MNKITMKRKIVCTRPHPFLPLFLWSLTLCQQRTHILTHSNMHTSNWDPFAFLFLFYHFISCEMTDRLHKCKKNEVGWGKKKTKWVRLEKQRQQCIDWIREKKSQMHIEEEQDREKQREMKRAGVLFIQLPLYWSSLQKRERLKRNKKEDVHYQTTLFASLHSSLSSPFLFIFFIAPKAKFSQMYG